MGMRESAAEENMLSALAGVRNAMDYRRRDQIERTLADAFAGRETVPLAEVLEVVRTRL